MRRDHVASTLIRRHFDVVCLLGSKDQDQSAKTRDPMISIYYTVSNDCVRRQRRVWLDYVDVQFTVRICAVDGAAEIIVPLSMLGKNFSRRHFKNILLFSQKRGFDISSKLPP